MVIQNMKKHLRHVLLWLFDKDNLIKNREAAREIQEVYGNGAITEQGCGKWLRKFRSGDKDVDDLEDEPRSGRPSNLNEEELKLLVEWDPKATVRELAEILQTSHMTVWRHLRDMGMVSF